MSPRRAAVPLVFPDGSNIAVDSFGNSGHVDPIRDDPDPVDVGVALLQPISEREYGQVERLLQHLWDAAANEALTASQEQQILAIAKLIEDQQRDTIPGETERWKLVGVVRGGLSYLAREAPKDILAWWKIGELLAEIDWHHVLPT